MSKHQADRATLIKEQREKGLTLQAIGTMFGITRERVRQILMTLDKVAK